MLQERVEELKEEYNKSIEQGDKLLAEYLEHINNQVQEEQQLSQEFNQMANKSNILLGSQLNSNKNDFERLKNLSQHVGVNLENRVQSND